MSHFDYTWTWVLCTGDPLVWQAAIEDLYQEGWSFAGNFPGDAGNYALFSIPATHN